MAHALARRSRVTVVTRDGVEWTRKSPVEVVRIRPRHWPESFVPRPGGSAWQLYYYAWTRELSRQLPRIISRTAPDLVQHLTYVRYWMPSATDSAGAPFLWGPVGGGEGMSDRFVESLPGDQRRSERFRSLIRSAWEADPALARTAANATAALATTAETATRMWGLLGKKVPVCPIVGLSEAELVRLSRVEEPADGPIQLLSIGRLIHWKGHDLAIEALAALPESVHYTLVGDGPERDRLERLAAAVGVADRVRITGWMDREEVLEQLASAHALVHPSYHDSGGMVCLEAMAAGRPVITLEGNGPALLTAEAGLPVAAPTRGAAIRGIARAAERLADDRDLRRHLGDAGRQRIRDHFLWGRRAEALEPHYRRALEGGRP